MRRSCSRDAEAAGAEAGQTDGMQTIEARDSLSFGALEVRALHTPGHTGGMLSFLVEDTGEEGAGAPAVFTGDTLFKDSVGGVRAPGHTTYTDLRDSIMGTLMELPAGHRDLPGPRRFDHGRA